MSRSILNKEKEKAIKRQLGFGLLHNNDEDICKMQSDFRYTQESFTANEREDNDNPSEI